jgi:hypothetical protein
LDPPSLFPRTDGDPAVWQRDVPESPRGVYVTLSSLGFRSAVAASLSSVLEPADAIHPKYFLSPKACAGILKRAARRAVALPALLADALVRRANSPS